VGKGRVVEEASGMERVQKRMIFVVDVGDGLDER